MNADKGNITVLITKEEYEMKINDFVDKGIETEVLKTNNEFLVNKLNAQLINTIRNNTNAIQRYENILKEIKRARGELSSKKMQFREHKQLTA